MFTEIRYFAIKKKLANHRSILIRDGKTLDVEVDGTCIEAQFKNKDGCVLIWLSDESPYDEGLHIYLVDENDNISDALEAGFDFNSGILKILNTGEDWIEFEFFQNDCLYRLGITMEVNLRLLLPKGWRYKKIFSLHRLVVHEMPKGGR
jgi:hypothetical protein